MYLVKEKKNKLLLVEVKTHSQMTIQSADGSDGCHQDLRLFGI
jgi:hypothetical protein